MSVRRAASQFATFLLTSVGLSVGVWYVFGEFSLTSSMNGEDLPGASVEIDGQPAGVTPMKIRFIPGQHKIVIRPPEGASARETKFETDLFSGGVGMALDAKFTSSSRAVRKPEAPKPE